MCVYVCVWEGGRVGGGGGSIFSDVGVKVFNIYQEIVALATTHPGERVVCDGCFGDIYLLIMLQVFVLDALTRSSWK